MKNILAVLFVMLARAQTPQTTAVTVTPSATPTFTATSGNTIFRYTLGANVTASTFVSAAPGSYTFRVCQPASGGTYTYTFAAFTGSVGMAAIPTGAGNCLDQAASWDGTILRFIPASTGGGGVAGSDGDIQVRIAGVGAGSALKQDTTTSQIYATKSIAGTATTQAFSATPTFNLSLGNRFEPGALTASVTAVTFTNPKAGLKFSIAWLQDGTGGRTVTYGASASNACGVWTEAGKTTTQLFEVAADGTSIKGIACSTDGNIGASPTRARPTGNPPSGTVWQWADTTNPGNWSTDVSGNNYRDVKTIANPSDSNCINYIGPDGVQVRVACSGGGGGGGALLTLPITIGSCMGSGGIAAGMWQESSSIGSTIAQCSAFGIADATASVSRLVFSDTDGAGNSLYFQFIVPAGYAGGTASLQINSYGSVGTGDVLWQVGTCDMAVGASAACAYNNATGVRAQRTAFTQGKTTISLNVTGWTAGDVVNMKWTRLDSACVSASPCPNGNMAGAEYAVNPTLLTVH